MFEKYPSWLNALRERTIALFNRYSLPRWIVFTMDTVSVFVIFIFAYLLRYNFTPAEISFDILMVHGLIVTAVYSIFSLVFQSYTGLIRHTTLTDISLIFVVTSVSAVTMVLLNLVSRFFNPGVYLVIPLSVILIHYVAITVFLFFIRIFIKVLFRFAIHYEKNKKRVLIYGAGEMGFVVKRVLMSDPRGDFNVVGFIDNSRRLQGKNINGLPVYSPAILSADKVQKNNIQTIIIAINKISASRKSELIRKAMSLDLEVLDTPSVDKWLNGQLQVGQIRKVKLEDLLNRDPIKLNMEQIGKGLNNKTILVTGAAGSIGSEIVRQLARFNIKMVILADQAETPMFNLDNELRREFGNLIFKPIIADVTNLRKMELIFKEFRPDVVFHAAAYKHVPIMEENVHEALRVNVGGTKVVAELSVKYDVKKFVMISSDKSVNPTSVMGASKRICEMLLQSIGEKPGVKTQFVVTRFGNVLGSNGSVVPIFRNQIADGGPVTVTHPDIMRYFMTIPEACELVLEAGFMGKGNQIYVFDMGEPVKITRLAEQMIKLSGFEPGKDIQIVYTGLRPGEKLCEELHTDKEETLPTYHPKIHLAQVEKFDPKVLLKQIDILIKNVYLLSKNDVLELFREIVPEYKAEVSSER